MCLALWKNLSYNSYELHDQEVMQQCKESWDSNRSHEETMNKILGESKYLKHLSWQQVVMVEDVNVIPKSTFGGCKNMNQVISVDSVTRTEVQTFLSCDSLAYIMLSTIH